MTTQVREEILETWAILEEIVIHTLVDGEIADTETTAGGIIHRMSNKSVYVEITRITGITEEKM